MSSEKQVKYLRELLRVIEQSVRWYQSRKIRQEPKSVYWVKTTNELVKRLGLDGLRGMVEKIGIAVLRHKRDVYLYIVKRWADEREIYRLKPRLSREGEERKEQLIREYLGWDKLYYFL